MRADAPLWLRRRLRGLAFQCNLWASLSPRAARSYPSVPAAQVGNCTGSRRCHNTALPPTIVPPCRGWMYSWLPGASSCSTAHSSHFASQRKQLCRLWRSATREGAGSGGGEGRGHRSRRGKPVPSASPQGSILIIIKHDECHQRRARRR